MDIIQALDTSNNKRTPTLKVYLKRGSYVESIHNVHAVICDRKGRVLMKAGDSNYQTFIRSALKPFQAIPFISSGAYEKVMYDEKVLAIACGSHSGTKKHARESFKLLWNSELNAEQLQCPVPKSKKSSLEHNCSGKHAAFLATCKKMNWPINSYLQVNHPLQIEINRRVSEMLGISTKELVTARDDCGAPTLRLGLFQIAFLYAQLSGSSHNELEQISRAMIREPELIAGEGRFDTEVIKRSHGQLISKGGSEGIQCLSKIGEGMGIAIKVEDGSRRAKQAVALHLLKQLDWITPVSLEELEDIVLKINPGVKLEVEGELRFQEK
ncbi:MULTISPECIES: asparaginase [Prochlorococcus]|uniref:L-asparaginase II n=1 Tax=Prochlorococcus marinus (strain SARG / CCMP1375 / SS120) TaxID=167539 RepID=Q7VC49_PROMA|nr:MULTISPECIES: asparaginase [Prochlorococcus]AAP99937.1 L-asparaginase II [Prochlorococcus marinus subsp. marinus str. CCMP1375]KGG11717.1 hypothetical protein EV04_0742 [Prochlorococcus marinus str. LG]KGG18870.1 hypothetical protein EV08_1356 [Prochlorococcus marinus str. SS2]KGG23592.1 hypothetical protein EV09_1217 [Prochlorococcus marinus str. SS35]KGG32172.1 hypothetical protein EV10_1286 [Prochlorococcus marinus str. SS51]